MSLVKILYLMSPFRVHFMSREVSNQIAEMWRDFGRWIEDQRDKLGITQEAAAERAQIKRQRWIKIAQGASTKRETVIRMAVAVKANPDVALEKAGFKVVNPSNDGGEIPNAELALFNSRVQKLTAQQKRDFKIAWQMANDLLDRLEREKQQQD